VPTTEAWLTRIHPDDKTSTVAAIEAVLRSNQQMWTGEYRFRRKDGSYAFVEDRGYVIRDAEGKAVRVVGGMTDITARKEAEEKLQRSRRQLRALSTRLQSLREEERTRIAREIHDELGQTLTALKMDLRWAEKHLTHESNQALNPILEKIVEAGELVDSTLDSVQRIASELRPRVLEDLGLAAAVQHEALRFQERTGVICRLKTPESLPTLSPRGRNGGFSHFPGSTHECCPACRINRRWSRNLSMGQMGLFCESLITAKASRIPILKTRGRSGC
jgi:signal transduction histidine kinase